MHKRPLEHKIKVIQMDSKYWSTDGDEIAKEADEMHRDGFTLVNVFAPTDKVALLMFTRPRR